MRGPKPKPTVIKKLEGNPGRRPLNVREPTHEVPGREFDEPPEELSTDPAAETEWRRLAPMLRRSKQVTDIERSSLIALCREWSRYLKAGEHVARLGMVVQAPKSGYPMVNPYLSIGNKALLHCSKLWAELGLTPSSRSRIHAVGAAGGEADSFAEFDAPVIDLKTFNEDDGNPTH